MPKVHVVGDRILADRKAQLLAAGLAEVKEGEGALRGRGLQDGESLGIATNLSLVFVGNRATSGLEEIPVRNRHMTGAWRGLSCDCLPHRTPCGIIQASHCFSIVGADHLTRTLQLSRLCTLTGAVSKQSRTANELDSGPHSVRRHGWVVAVADHTHGPACPVQGGAAAAH